MDVTVLLEPEIDLERLAEVLDGLGHEGRAHAARTWTKQHKARLYEAAKGRRPIELDFVVPASVGPLVEVVHEGHNTLPMFTRFEKRFVRLPEGEEYAVAGYNEQAWRRFNGPGYFVVTKGEGEHEGELVLDYTKVPKSRPPSWPEIQKNEGGLAGMVNGGLVDYVRALSTHVSIGTATRHGKDLGQFFTLVRKDPG